SVGSTVSLATVASAAMMVWYQQPLILVILVPLVRWFPCLQNGFSARAPASCKHDLGLTAAVRTVVLNNGLYMLN
ncbi:hypothetical protein FU659_06710, partial [Paenibacillus sp. N3.4]